MITFLNNLIDLFWLPTIVLMIILVCMGYGEPERRRKWPGA
jgi:hypothetical protein